MLLDSGRLTAQELIVTLKATTVDRLNNDMVFENGFCNTTQTRFHILPGQSKRSEQTSLSVSRERDKQLRIRQVGLHNCSYLQEIEHAAQTPDCHPATTSMLLGELQIRTYTF